MQAALDELYDKDYMQEEPDDELLTNPETLTTAQAKVEQHRPANSCESYKLITAQAEAAHAMATKMLAEMQEFKVLWRPWAFFVDTFVTNLGAPVTPIEDDVAQ